jgi:hypothetical protein
MGDAFVVLKNRTEAAIWYQKGLDLWDELQDQHALWAKEINMPKVVAEDLSRTQSTKPQERQLLGDSTTALEAGQRSIAKYRASIKSPVSVPSSL